MKKVLNYNDKHIDEMTIKEYNQIFDSYSYNKGILKFTKEIDNTIYTIEVKPYGRALLGEFAICPNNLSEDDELDIIKKLRSAGKTQTKTGEITGKSQSTVSRKEKKIREQENKLIIEID